MFEKRFIKVLKSDIHSGAISDRIGELANIFYLNLDENDLFTDRCLVHEIGDYYYIYNVLFDLDNKCRNKKQSEEEIKLIQDLINNNNLETISISDMNILLQEVENEKIK